MCLINAKKITTQEDIVCYKILRVNPNELDSDMWSPYFKHKIWKIGRTETLKRDEPDIFYYGDYDEKKISVGSGAYHSYQNIHNMPVEFFLRSEYVVCKCIIPKSSKYIYKGFVNGNGIGYASQKLKPIEFVHVDKFELFKMLYSSNPSNN